MPAAAAKPKKTAASRSAAASAPAPVLEVVPKAPADAGIEGLDDALGEIAPPGKASVEDDFDDILGEIAGPAKADRFDDLDDILGEITGPVETDDLDDILGEISGPAKTEASDDLDDILGELEPGDRDDDVLTEGADDEIAAELGEPETAHPDPAEAPKKKKRKLALGGKFKPLLAKLAPDLKGTRTVSRKRLALLNGLVAVLGLAVVGEGAVIALRPAAHHAPAPAPHAERIAITVVPVDYAKVDLHRYIDKVRMLSEGGRDMLRHPQIKAAVVALDNGEALYQDMSTVAAHSPAAERIAIRDNHVTLVTCDGNLCGDKSYKLVYDIPHDQATLCVTEKYTNGALLSYSYSEEGYSEQPGC